MFKNHVRPSFMHAELWSVFHGINTIGQIVHMEIQADSEDAVQYLIIVDEAHNCSHIV